MYKQKSLLLCNLLGLLIFPLTLTTEITDEQTIRSELKKTVCNNFCIIRYSGSKDTLQTIEAVRAHNAALRSFKCTKLRTC